MIDDEKVRRFTNKDFEKESTTTVSRRTWLWILLLIVIAIIATLCIWGNANADIDPGKEDTIVVAEDSLPRNGSDDAIVEKQNEGANEQVVSKTTTEFATMPATKKDNKIQYSKKNEDTDVYLMAKRVIRGDFGNGDIRKKALGEDYQTIQNQVNENYRKGNLYW